MVQQDVQAVAELVRSLEDAAKMAKGEKKRRYTCKKSTFEVAGAKNVHVDSWKFMDWDYKRRDLPTYARGLFTTRRKDGTPEIAVRGYDKFFNIDETYHTEWANIERFTRGPYELSVKENGCIIFISALEDETLLVCSKHSTGVRSDTDVSHAQAGEAWVERHVTSVGRSVKDLARELRRMNATAVGELCDDSFEEHVLAYPETAAGIYLHGINFNVPEFTTVRGSEVHQFADAWGFKKANFLVYDDIKAVRAFLEKCAETGTWDGRETEGFVIRCQMSQGGTGPYRDWFFKYKFEEPYLLYRQWRECTKAIIAGRLPKIKKHKQITEEYLQYARRQLAKDPRIGRLYNQNHGIIAMRNGFLQERGLKGADIIRMEAAGDHSRQVRGNIVLVPVASLGCGKTTVALALVHLFGWGHIQNDNIPKQKNRPKRFAFDVSNCLLAGQPVVIADRNNHQRREREQLFDDIQPVVPDARFVALHWVHEPKEQLLPEIREVTRQRVLERGDNHQTIRAGSKSSREIIGIMDGFLDRFQGVDTVRDPDVKFDEVINLDVTASSRQNLETIVQALHNAYPLVVPEVPSAADLDAAIATAMHNYHVDKDLSGGYGSRDKGGPKRDSTTKTNRSGADTPTAGSTSAVPDPETLAQNIEYFCISVPTQEVSQTLHSLFNAAPSSSSASPITPEKARMYHHLVKSRRVQPSFHVTLIHRASKETAPQLWSRYTQHYVEKMKQQQQQHLSTTTAAAAAAAAATTTTTTTTPPLGTVRIRLERLVWNDRVMAFVVRILPGEHTTTTSKPTTNTNHTNNSHSASHKDGEEGEEEDVVVVSQEEEGEQRDWHCANPIAHITVGTASAEIKPKESNDLLQRWLEVGSGDGTGIFELDVPGVKVVKGMVGVVMGRERRGRK